MSEATVLTPNPDARLKHGKRLTEPQKRAIVAAVAVKGSMQLVAHEFGVHRNTVAQLCKDVRAVPNSGLSYDWRKKLTDELPNQSVAAIEKSITDVEDVHKAASTAIAHLKGIGALQGDAGATVNVFMGSIANLPTDLASDYFEVEHTPCP